MAEAEKRLGAAERDFIHTASINFLTPLRNFLEGDWKTISVRDRGPLCFLGAVASCSSELLGRRLSSRVGKRALLGLLRRGSCGLSAIAGDLPCLGLSFPMRTRWPSGISQGCPGSHSSLSPAPQKERRLLQNRRLDLDACKARLKKAKAAEAKATVGVPAGLLPLPSSVWSQGG